MATYYIDGTTLSNSTTVYSNPEMTICAPDGFYSDGVIVRELVSCNLLPAQVCPECAEPCGGSIAGSGGQGIYLLNLDTGTTATDIGAIIITFNPAAVPDGIRATFDGTVYNKLSSPVDGYHGSTNPNNFTFIGATSSDCGISGSTYPALNEYSYVNGSFQLTGNTQSVTVDAGDVSLGSAPGNCVMVIPKPNPTPNIVNFEFVGPCSGTAWSINVSCPAALPSFGGSLTPRGDQTTACADSITETYYHASVTGSAGTPALYDWIFTDPNGQATLAAGWYLVDAGGGNTYPVEVDANGVIITVGTCA